MVNNHGIIIHKQAIRKEEEHDYDIYKENHPVTPKQVVNVFDLGYLGVEKDFPEQLSLHYRIERREIMELSQRRKRIQQKHSKKRIVIEHTICRLKKYRILQMYLETN